MLAWLKKILPAETPRTAGRDTGASAAPGPHPSTESASWQSRGDAYFEEGRLDEAAECFQRMLALYPGNGEALCSLGMVALQQGLLEEGERWLRQAVSADPQLAQACYFLGSALQKQGRLDEAVDLFGKALELRPDAEFIYSDLCYALFQAGRTDAARRVIMQGLSRFPQSADLQFFLGNLYGHEKNAGEAIACYRQALSIRPDHAPAWLNMGKLYYELGRTTDPGMLEEAVACYRKALAIAPDLADALFNLGLALQLQKKDEALECYRKVLQLDPEHGPAKTGLFRQMQHRCDWDFPCAAQEVRRIVLGSPPALATHFPPLAFVSLPGTTAADQKVCAERYAQGEFQHLAARRHELGLALGRPADDRIHIGYLSADLRQHPVAVLMAEVFELHDRSRFRVSAYSYGPDDASAMRKRLERGFDRFVDLRNKTDEEAASMIHADRVDVLVDLTGHTQGSRSGILALRPAPVQVNYLGYPGTLGAEFVDYLIADRFVIPEDQKQHYAEQVAWLPDCFMPCDRTRARHAAPRRSDCGLPESGFVFCCFNQAHKITPEIFDIWCRLVAAVPGSVLWLSSANAQAEANLRRTAEARGIEPGRIIMAPRVPEMEAHLARLQCADLFLDTIPYNAHTTCSDALWMGLPVVTCAGDTFASRVAGSLLSALGVPELITRSLDDYFRLALELATDRRKLAALRSEIVARRDTAPLFDSTRFTRNLEEAYAQMVAQHAQRIALR